MGQLSAEGTAAAAAIGAAQPHSGDSFWEVLATPEMQMAASRRKPPDCCASLSLLLEKPHGEHPSTPSLLLSSQPLCRQSYPEMNPTRSRGALLFPSALLPGMEHGRQGWSQGLSHQVSPRVSRPAARTFACGHRNPSRRRRRRWPFAWGAPCDTDGSGLAMEPGDEEGSLHPAAAAKELSCAWLPSCQARVLHIPARPLALSTSCWG